VFVDALAERLDGVSIVGRASLSKSRDDRDGKNAQNRKGPTTAQHGLSLLGVTEQPVLL
jgi:hypothetical protein